MDSGAPDPHDGSVTRVELTCKLHTCLGNVISSLTCKEKENIIQLVIITYVHISSNLICVVWGLMNLIREYYYYYYGRALEKVFLH